MINPRSFQFGGFHMTEACGSHLAELLHLIAFFPLCPMGASETGGVGEAGLRGQHSHHSNLAQPGRGSDKGSHRP